MNHQLILQFQGNDAATLEKVIELEDRLIEALIAWAAPTSMGTSRATA